MLDAPTARDVLDRLDGVHQVGESCWIARCPAHDDPSAPFLISVGPPGRVRVECAGHCDASVIMAAIGLGDVGADSREPPSGPPRSEREGRAPGEHGAAGPPHDDYRVIDGALCHVHTDRLGERTVHQLTNFVATIDAQIVRDDGGEPRTFFEIRGRLATGEPLPPLIVAARDYPGLA